MSPEERDPFAIHGDAINRVWKKIVDLGCRNASQALHSMLSTPLEMTGIVIAFMPLSKIPFLAGDPEGQVAGIRLLFSGEVSGHMLLLFPQETCLQLVNLLMGQPPEAGQGSSSLGEVEISALAELGNITSSNFIKELANFTNLHISLTPPEILLEMTATVMQETLTTLSATTNKVLTIEATFSSMGYHLEGYFFFIPDPPSLDIIMEKFWEILAR